MSKAPVLKPESIDTVFNAEDNTRIPFMWFGIMMLPVFIAMVYTAIGGLSSNTAPDASTTTQEISRLKSPIYTPSLSTLMSGNKKSAEITQQKNALRAMLNKAPCSYANYRGNYIHKKLVDHLKALNRPVSILKENKKMHILKKDDPRIYMYVNESTHIISRVECW